MLRTLLKSKIHRARVTRADLHYEGSISIDAALMKAADLVPHEHVHVWNVTNGKRFETYAIPAPKGSGQIQILVQGRMRVVSAFTKAGRDLVGGSKVRVVGLIDQNTLLVEPLGDSKPG